MADWTDDFHPDNPAVVLYRMWKDNPDQLTQFSRLLGGLSEAGALDEEAFRHAAEKTREGPDGE